MSQYNKYVKMAQEMINEGVKGKKNEDKKNEDKKMEDKKIKFIKGPEDINSYFVSLIAGKKDLYFSTKENDDSPHGGAAVYLSTVSLANDEFQSEKVNLKSIHKQMMGVVKSVKELKGKDKAFPSMDEYYVVLNDNEAINFGFDDIEAEAFILVI